MHMRMEDVTGLKKYCLKPSLLICSVSVYVLQSYKIINFAPTLLQIIMSDQVEFPVRQAGKTNNT